MSLDLIFGLVSSNIFSLLDPLPLSTKSKKQILVCLGNSGL